MEYELGKQLEEINAKLNYVIEKLCPPKVEEDKK